MLPDNPVTAYLPMLSRSAVSTGVFSHFFGFSDPLELLAIYGAFNAGDWVLSNLTMSRVGRGLIRQALEEGAAINPVQLAAVVTGHVLRQWAGTDPLRNPAIEHGARVFRQHEGLPTADPAAQPGRTPGAAPAAPGSTRGQR
jgi:hypothetical protein